MADMLLTRSAIDEISAETETWLTENKADEKDALRLKLLLEEVLLVYLNAFGEEHAFDLQKKKTLGRLRVVLSVPGERRDPFAKEDAPEFELLRRLHVDMGVNASWAYRDGTNRISFTPKKKRRMSAAKKTLVAIGAALLTGFLCMQLPETVSAFLLDGLISPVLSTIMGTISAIAGPMIFFSLVWGVCTIGDVHTLNQIGKKMLGRFFLALAVFCVLATVICYPFFRGASSAGASFQITEFIKMILGIVPSNMIAPFIDGNTQQIIFMAIVIGIVLLLLGERVSAVTDFFGHMNVVVQTLMEIANILIPLMVFLSVLKIMLGRQFSVLAKSWKILPIYLAVSLIVMILSTLSTSVGQKLPAGDLVKKAMPVFMIGLTTASSSAALSPNMKSCKEDYGIDEKIVDFGVPLGQTLYKPGGMVRFVCIGFGLAELYGVAVTPNALAILIVTCLLLAVSAPPVVGGAAVCFAILLEQMGIPEEAIGIAMTLNVFFDFVLTGVNLYCLQMELTSLAGSLHMLDFKKQSHQ